MSECVSVPAELVEALREKVNYAHISQHTFLIDAARALVDAVERPTEDEPLCTCGHNKAAHEYEYSPVKGHCSHGGTNGVPECRCAKFRPVEPPPSLPDRDEAPSISDEAEALTIAALREVVKQPPQVVPTNSGGLQLEWHRYGLDIEIDLDPKGDVMGWWARLDRATKENNHE